MGKPSHGVEHYDNSILTVAGTVVENASSVDHGSVKEHAFVAPKRPCKKHKGVKCNSVELDAIREQNHCSQDTISESCSLGCCSLAFIFEEVRQALEAHDLGRRNKDD